MRTVTLLLAILACCLPNVRRAGAYPVGVALGLSELVEQADLICKVVVVDSEPAEESPYRESPGFKALATRLQLIEAYKGVLTAKEVTFLHLAPSKDGMGFRYMPQYYQFEPGKPYILFAKKTDRGGVYQMLWENHKSKEDQGLVRAANTDKHGKVSIRDVLWAELTKLLESKNAAERKYALSQLDQMSGGGYEPLKHFDREKVMEAIESLVRSDDSEVAKQAIQALGSRNPFIASGAAPGYLLVIGKGHIPGYGKWNVTENVGGRKFWKSLAAVADSDAETELRALAIRALGLARNPEIKERLVHWLDDPQPQVRQAAAMLLADFPDLAKPKTIRRLAKDREPLVRAGVAKAIGFGQFRDHLHLLGVLINDPDPNVAQMAALSLLSFPLDGAQMTLQANLEHPEYGCLIVNALARDNPEMYLEPLCEIVRKNLLPKHWWGGSTPWGVSWNILFKYVQSRPAEELKKGKHKEVLETLESPRYFSSSEPRDLYALYIQRGMTEQAKSFRQRCRKRLTYDIDYYFKQVDESPDTYQRR